MGLRLSPNSQSATGKYIISAEAHQSALLSLLRSNTLKKGVLHPLFLSFTAAPWIEEATAHYAMGNPLMVLVDLLLPCQHSGLAITTSSP